MKMGEEVLIKVKVIGLITNMSMNRREGVTAARVEIDEAIDIVPGSGSGVNFLIDSANIMLIPEKK